MKHIVVCSDESVAAEVDSIFVHEDESDFVVVKDIEKIKELTKDCEEYRVISTYQSLPKLIKAFKGKNLDFGFFDEAHRTTQPNGHRWASGLFDRNIKIKKRLFATATRRFVESNKRQCNTMSDEGVYGPVFYHEPFTEAVKKGIVSPVKIITNKITTEGLNRELIKYGMTTVGWDRATTRRVANIIGFLKAVKKYDIKTPKFSLDNHSKLAKVVDVYDGDSCQVVFEHNRLINKWSIGLIKKIYINPHHLLP